MRKGLLGALGALLIGAGTVAANSAPAFKPAAAVPYPTALGGSSAPGQMMPAYGVSNGYPPGMMVQPGWTPQPAVRVFNVAGQAPASPTPLPAPSQGPAKETLPAPVAPPSEPVVSTPIGPSSSLPYPDIAASVFADEGRPGILPYEEDCDCKRWISAEYLLWILRRSGLPENFVTAGAPANSGLGGSFDYDVQHGVRLHAGKWLCTDFGVEAGGFMLFENNTRKNFFSDGNGTPAISRPFFNTDTGVRETAVVSFPTAISGSLRVESTSQLWGAEANLLANVGRGEFGAVNLLGGARFLHLNEGFDVTQSSTLFSSNGTGFFLGTPLTLGQGVVIRDAFDTNNDFIGGQLGAQFGAQCGKVFVGITTKVAVGVTYETVDVRGNSTLLVGDGTTQTASGGFLALPSNRTRQTSSVLTFVPEGNFELAYQVSPRLTASLGYTFLYWTRVARASEQVSTMISGTQVPVGATFVAANPAGQPRPPFEDGSFWAQGLSAALAFRY